MRLGIFGGTFDPPHLAHLILAAEALYELDLERVLWVLTPEPPHKGGIKLTDVDIRLEMLSTAIAGEPAFEISTVEVDRPGPHYAVDTMHILREQHPQDELVYLMGEDSLHDLPTWERPLEFLAYCHKLGVMRRAGNAFDLLSLERHLPGITSKVVYVSATAITISASDIRRRAASGQPFRYMVTEGVYRIILVKGLYRSK